LILAVGGDESRCKGRSLQTCTDETMWAFNGTHRNLHRSIKCYVSCRYY
jgi:hypothetical protein